jgi:[ribosomal protein S5]-alanine N-acetyltransferase
MVTAGEFTLRPLARSDAIELQALWTTPGGRRYLWDGEIIPFERTLSIVDESARLFAAHGFGLWGARSTDPSPLAGFAGLWYFRDPPELELLYGVDENLWGHGIAVTIASAVIAYACTELKLRRIGASTDASNIQSVRVLEKLGFEFIKRQTVERLDTVFYELDARASALPAQA